MRRVPALTWISLEMHPLEYRRALTLVRARVGSLRAAERELLDDPSALLKASPSVVRRRLRLIGDDLEEALAVLIEAAPDELRP